MLSVCSTADNPTRPRQPAPPGEGRLANSGRKCRSVQFGLVPQDFHRLRQISEKLGWSRAELARRCLLLVMEFLEDQYPELQNREGAALEESLSVEQLSLWPPLHRPASPPGSSSS